MSCPTCLKPANSQPFNNRLLEDIVAEFVRNASSDQPVAVASKPENRRQVVDLDYDDYDDFKTSGPVPVKARRSTSELAECPICSASVHLKDVNKHLDSKCALYKVSRQAKTSLAYAVLKTEKIAAIMRQEHLSLDGNRATMIKRHAKYVMLYNSNLDKQNPEPVETVRKELARWELEQQKSRASHLFSNTKNNHENDPQIAQRLISHAEKYKDAFEELTRDIRERRKRSRETAEIGND